MSAPDALLEQLLADGYCILQDAVPQSVIHALEADLDPVFAETPFGSGNFYGYTTKRFGSLLRRSRHIEELVLQPAIMTAVQAVLREACERIQLNVAQAIEIHPGEIEQFPHADHDMWAGPKGEFEYLVNVIWPLTPFTSDNGGTRIYPGTHRQPPASLEELAEPVVAACPPGSAICILGSTIHGAGANETTEVRRAVVLGYSLGWLKPYENLWLAYPPQVARNFSRELAALAGYTQHRPNLGNFEGQCPSVLLRDEPVEPLGAIDALRPDQQAMLDGFARQRRGGQ